MSTFLKVLAVPGNAPQPPEPAKKPQDAGSQAAVILGVVSPFFALSTFLFLTQLYQRLKSLSHYRSILGWDDLFLFLAVLANLIAFTCMVIAICSGFNDQMSFLPREQKDAVLLWLTIARPIWIWSSAFVKMSLASTIIRAKVDPISRAVMSTFVVLTPILTLSLWIPALIKSDSVRTPHDLDVLNSLYATVAAIFFFCNLVLTSHPLFFLLTTRPLGETLIAIFLCFLGILAMICSLLRLVFQLWIYRNALPIAAMAISPGTVTPFTLLISLEVSLSIIAACTPTMFDILRRFSAFVPSSWRRRLAKSSKPQPKPQYRASISGSNAKPPPNFLYRWSRDLGLDALPDNTRMSQAPRPRSSWINWRQSYIPRRTSLQRPPTYNPSNNNASSASFVPSSPYYATESLAAHNLHPAYTPRANSLPTPPGSPLAWHFPQPPSRPATSSTQGASSPMLHHPSVYATGIPSSAVSEVNRNIGPRMWMQWEHEESSSNYDTDDEDVSVREFPRGVLPHGGRVVSMSESFTTSEEHLPSRLVVRNL